LKCKARKKWSVCKWWPCNGRREHLENPSLWWKKLLTKEF
jgi:hypothetical protein